MTCSICASISQMTTKMNMTNGCCQEAKISNFQTVYNKGGQLDELQELHFRSKIRQESCINRIIFSLLNGFLLLYI